MGVEPKDCRLVAELIGIKTFLNEFVAYERLAGFIGNRQMGTGQYMSVSNNYRMILLHICNVDISLANRSKSI